jgi:hypothetical protein
LSSNEFIVNASFSSHNGAYYLIGVETPFSPSDEVVRIDGDGFSSFIPPDSFGPGFQFKISGDTASPFCWNTSMFNVLGASSNSVHRCIDLTTSEVLQ